MNDAKRKTSWIKPLRVGIQVFFLGLFAFIAVRHQFTKGGPTGSPPLDAYCPFGGVEGLYRYLVMGEMIPRIFSSNFVLLSGVVVMTLLVKSAFCSWVCPLGSVQEWLGRLGSKVFGKNFSPPKRMDTVLRGLKYAVLIVVFIGSAWAGYLVFRDYDPFIALFHLGWGHLEWTAYLVLLLTLAVALFVMRPWCKYLCPFGALLAPLGKLSFIKPVRQPDTCKECKRCDAVCQMGIAVSEGTRVASGECHACLDCIAADLHPGSLKLRTATGHWMPLIVVPAVVLISIFGFVYGGKAAGLYSTEKGDRCGACDLREICGGAPEQPPAKEEHGGHGGGNTVVADGRQVVIRGSMSLTGIEKETGVPADYIIKKLNMPASVSRQVNMGRLKQQYGFEMPKVREVIEEYLKEGHPPKEE